MKSPVGIYIAMAVDPMVATLPIRHDVYLPVACADAGFVMLSSPSDHL